MILKANFWANFGLILHFLYILHNKYRTVSLNFIMIEMVNCQSGIDINDSSESASEISRSSTYPKFTILFFFFDLIGSAMDDL